LATCAGRRPLRTSLRLLGWLAGWLADLPEDLVDIDVLIGEPEFIDRGVGPRSLSLLLARLRVDPFVTIAGVGTSVSNERAIRAFEKAGFRASVCFACSRIRSSVHTGTWQ